MRSQSRPWRLQYFSAHHDFKIAKHDSHAHSNTTYEFYLTRLSVLPAIDFNNDASRMACKVCEEWTDRCLPAEMCFWNMPKPLPQLSLGVGGRLTHVAGAFDTTIRLAS